MLSVSVDSEEFNLVGGSLSQQCALKILDVSHDYSSKNFMSLGNTRMLVNLDKNTKEGTKKPSERLQWETEQYFCMPFCL